ncbi:MAG: response regulator, partial [Gammaproteobacteria bacterium]
MRRDIVPACYFPTTVALVDDNRNFLNGLNIDLLHARKTIPLLYENAQEALQFLNETYQPNRFIDRCLRNQEETSMEQRIIDIDLSAIRREIYNPHRFNEISIVFVDYVMPNLNGLEFFEQLNDRWIKKVLLTDEADEKLAVKAFNQGIIHKFIRKDTANFTRIVNTVIQELQYQYFCDLSRIIVDHLARKTISELSCLEDPAFIKFFNRICQENEAMEYYLADECGSFLLLDFQGQPSWLGVKSQEDMEVALQLADFSDDPFPATVLEAMKSREKMLYIYGETYSSDVVKCEKFLFPAQKLDGQQTYYYTLIKNPEVFDIKSNQVLSYKERLAGK